MITEPYDDLFEAALAMPEPLRSELADRLILSLSPPPCEVDLATVLRERIELVERGDAVTMSFDEAMTELRRRQEARKQQ